MQRRCCTAWGKWWWNQILTGFLIHAPVFFLRYLWQPDAYLYSQSCAIHRLGPNEFIYIYWLPYMNCNSVKIFEIVACCIYIFVQYNNNPFGKKQISKSSTQEQCVTYLAAKQMDIFVSHKLTSSEQSTCVFPWLYSVWPLRHVRTWDLIEISLG